MTQGDAVRAYGAITRMGSKATGAAAFTLFRLKKGLQEIFEFQNEQEKELVQKFGGQLIENGLVVIADKEKREQFQAEVEKLHGMECDIQPVKIPAAAIPEISLAEIEALDGFVIFE